ncbi:hypothetical protein Acid345_1965 [Candidatus Koribacter versatilis Ellin345]|uniref:Uncharacterized protein n=1 Tax=Koribacter versatilis (strain Ellin345) TaxID=204669 RepID=Q1IQ84_KORVE|nr:nucleotidyltransferase family protein [Candidatus Koribacter versatilis]ABF40966.1 hypothetical protein Acid345_1965 [Candidatus Koribacter versatilis Ellin345]
MATAVANEREHIQALSQLTLNPAASAEAVRHFAALNQAQRDELLSLADSNHVVIRGFQPVMNGALSMNLPELAQWAQGVIEKERGRIINALSKLEVICNALEAAGCQTTVMKSLDHWPDLGNDLDLYSTADEKIVCKVMTEQFKAHIEPRSWGDRLANKWNFQVPGLPEAIEVHAKRLGQTGEHTALARRFVTRRVQKTVEGMTFYVPAPEERVIVATLQRMYRHFYFRVCDIVNTTKLVESGTIDYAELKKAADIGGIWPGVASYLRIVCDYVKAYRGVGFELPQEVLNAAPFGGEKVFVKGRFIRVPIMPQGADLYTRQVTSAAFRGDVPATFRLSLLPPLASAAAVAFKITGSDKGIW